MKLFFKKRHDKFVKTVFRDEICISDKKYNLEQFRIKLKQFRNMNIKIVLCQCRGHSTILITFDSKGWTCRDTRLNSDLIYFRQKQK